MPVSTGRDPVLDPKPEEGNHVLENSPTVDPADARKTKEEVVIDLVSLEAVSPSTSDEFPDGGLAAWLVVIGGALAVFSTSGYLSSWGAFQAYYELTYIPGTSASRIAWIGSVQYATLSFPALVTGRLCDMGYFKHTLLFFSVLLVVATILTGECKTYLQLLLCQGFAVGISCGMIFGPVLTVIGHWFSRRRALVFGIASIGAAMGGVLFPIAARKLFEVIGFRWAMRTLALILFVTLGVANLTMKRRLPVPADLGPFFALHDFKKPGFVLYTCAGTIAFLGLYTMITYIDVSAVGAGIDPEFSFYLVAIINGAGAFGRVSAGYFGDKFGAMTVIIPFTVVCGITTFVWPFLESKAGYTAVSVIYGVAEGGFVSLVPVPVVGMGDIQDLGRRLGMSMAFFAISVVVGPPISGAIYASTGGYEAVGYFAGSSVVVSALLIMFAKRMHTGRFTGKF